MPCPAQCVPSGWAAMPVVSSPAPSSARVGVGGQAFLWSLQGMTAHSLAMPPIDPAKFAADQILSLLTGPLAQCAKDLEHGDTSGAQERLREVVEALSRIRRDLREG